MGECLGCRFTDLRKAYSGIDFMHVYFSVYLWLFSQDKYKQSSVSFVFICASCYLKEKLNYNCTGHFLKIIISFRAGSWLWIWNLSFFNISAQCINFKTGKPKWCIVLMQESIYRKDWNFTKPGLWALITHFSNKTEQLKLSINYICRLKMTASLW